MEARSLDDFLFLYEKFATAENKSPRSIEAVVTSVRRFNNFLGGCDDIRQVQAEDLRGYIRYLQKTPRWASHPTIRNNHGNLSPAAIASYVRSIRSLWSWLQREEFISVNHLEHVKPPKTPSRAVTPLTSQQVTGLLKTIPRKTRRGYRDFSIIICLYGTGLRISELFNLKLPDVNFDTGQIKVLGKGNKERSVYLSANGYKAMFKYRSQWRPEVTSEYLFVHDDGRPLTRFYFAHRMQVYVKEAGLDELGCTPHRLRFSFAVQFLRNGGDVFTLQRILGHSTLEMTRHYARIAESDIEEKQKIFSPAENLEVKI